MKRILIITLMLLSLFIPISYAHSGRTDANGGHWDRENGTYHFHTGESAGKNHLNSSSESEYVPFTPPYEPPTENPYRQEENTKGNVIEDKDFLWYLKTIGMVFLFEVIFLGNSWAIFTHIKEHEFDENAIINIVLTFFSGCGLFVLFQDEPLICGLILLFIVSIVAYLYFYDKRR